MDSEKLLPVGEPVSETVSPAPQLGVPSQKAQSWGTVISIIVIVGMIIVGAFYSWGKRIAQDQVPAGIAQ